MWWLLIDDSHGEPREPFCSSVCVFLSFKRWNSGKLGTTVAAIFLASAEKSPRPRIASTRFNRLFATNFSTPDTVLIQRLHGKSFRSTKERCTISAKLILKNNFLRVVFKNVLLMTFHTELYINLGIPTMTKNRIHLFHSHPYSARSRCLFLHWSSPILISYLHC